ncbi:DNA-binding protein RIF1 SKDI_02G3830 [Saccharomyces kudriavzevii IFO 1802]|uniref:Telomere-associated protein Rif1 N-terminal domain-containing protein n=1 Tax=Saccharomyces kudriavzevii (strain ATCC MYA-4449 / AS 2.2408 / CBS 8840 / NBRC 1802 / NCYC 2889) TaxID=226230 RepID=A0AA35NN20_SACK1|nr:uncharacterized protein SKDI_02G3830 [Saccharomyces kudriavzevii IFO 1802]CAI4056135.1 hypothetical protein SKDI_02G3830 [Saccharomyces kudriavzevii IFO 1802]
MSKDFSDKKKHTIDRIDQHILRRSQQDASSNGSSPWMKVNLPPPPSPQARMHVQGDLSPTPKRRKLASPNNYENNQYDSSANQRSLCLQDAGNKLVQSLPELSASNSDNASPVTKSVAFSDRIESSPIHHVPGSSPKPSPSSKPGKSILRNRMPSTRSASDLSHNKLQRPQHQMHDGNIFTSPYKEPIGINPRTLDYWVSGEIHSLVESESVSEFKETIEGGLGILRQESAEYVARRFEVYATFNNIIPILTDKNAAEVDQKFNVLIVNIEGIVEICIPHLRTAQDTLLSSSEKKNPFIIRLYVQIVRFFGAIMANFKIMKWLMKRPDLVKKLKVIYNWTADALKNDNSNKIIITAQVSFLRDERFGTFFLSNDEIRPIIRVFTEIMEINSNNLIYEKLLLIRGFLSKYPELMIETVTSWLPGEVLPRIIIGDEVYSMKILITSIVVLLELLKKCLDFVEEHERIYRCVMVLPITETVPEKFLSKLSLNSSDAADLKKVTIGHLLTHQIKYYIVNKNDSKLAMDLWLSMTGLLYDNGKRVYDLTSESNELWFGLNNMCFIDDHPKTRLMSIKVWRIVTYCICTKISLKNQEGNKKLLLLLQAPFQMTLPYVNDPSAREGIIYHFLGVVYTAFTSNKNLSTDMFDLFWNNLIAPIYENYVFKYNSIQLQNVLLTILHLLIGGNNEDIALGRKNKKLIHSMSVMASEGVKLKDISSLPPSIIKSAYDKIMDVVFQAIKRAMPNINLANNLIFTSLKHLPEDKKDKSHLEAFSSLILEVAENNKDKPIFHDCFGAICSSLVHTFLELFLKKSDSSLIDFNIKLSRVSNVQENMTLDLLKDVIRKARNETSEFLIMEKFLELDDKKIGIYAQNWVGSTLLSSNISFREFQSLANIVDKVPNESSIENFLDLCLKLSFPVNLFTLLHVSEWSNDNFIYFIQSYVSKDENRLDEDLITLLKFSLPGNPELFLGLYPFLRQHKFMNILEYCICSNPTLLSYISDLNSDYLMNLLPLSRASYFAANIKSFKSSEQLTIIRWLLKGQKLDQINENFSEIKNVLLNAPADGSEKPRIIEELFQLAIKNPIEPLFTDLLNFCINNSIVDYLDEFCGTINDEIISKINPVLLLNLLTYKEKPNEALLTALIKKIENEEDDYMFMFLKETLARKELSILERLKEPFFIFFLDPDRSSKQKNDNSANMFRELVQLYLTKPLSRSAAKKFFSMLVSILPPKPSHQTVNMVHLLVGLIKSHSRKFKDKRTYNATLRTVEKWIQESEIINQGDSSKEIDTSPNAGSICTSHDLQDEKNAPASLSKATTIEDIQVPATQRMKDLSSSYQMPLQGIAEDLDTKQNETISDVNLAQRQIPANLSRSFTDETLEEVDNQSSREIDQQAKSTQLHDKITNYESVRHSKSDDAEVSELHEDGTEEHQFEGNVDKQTGVIADHLRNVTNEYTKSKIKQNKIDDDALQRSSKETSAFKSEKSKRHRKGEKVVGGPSPERDTVFSSTEIVHLDVKNQIRQEPSSTPKDNRKVDTNSSQDSIVVALSSEERSLAREKIKGEDKRGHRSGEHDFINSTENEKVTEGKITQEQSMNVTALRNGENEEKGRTHVAGQASLIINKGQHSKIQIPSQVILLDNPEPGEGLKAGTLDYDDEDERDAVMGEIYQADTIDSRSVSNKRIDDTQAQNVAKESREAIAIERTLNVHVEGSMTSKTSEKLEDVHREREEANTNDDFVPVEEHGGDEVFLKEMEQEASREASLLKEEYEAADTSVLPEIRIPIFNSLKIQESKSQAKEKLKSRLKRNESMPPDSPPRLAASTNTNIKNVHRHLVAVGKTIDEKVEKHDQIQLGLGQIEINDDPSLMGDGNEDATSREATPSLKIHFSTKKSRKLVSRLRGFTPGDLNGISVEERRNLRIELLDFMMRLEYYSNRDNDVD